MAKPREIALKFIDSGFFKAIEAILTDEFKANTVVFLLFLTAFNVLALAWINLENKEKMTDAITVARFDEHRKTVNDIESQAKSETHYVGLNGLWYECHRPK